MPDNSKSEKEQELAGLSKEAIILLGHGSRVPDAGRDMEQVAAGLRGKYGYPWVEICFMSRLGPHLPEVLEKCVHAGAEKVVVIPYFLHMGLHIVLDIPEMLKEQALRFPHVKLTMGRGFGYDDLLVDIIQRRIQETRELSDVRGLVLPPKEKYPVPPGQCEFVPMSPDAPHPYMIGARHVSFAAENYRGILSTDSISEAEKNGIVCEICKGKLSYEQHEGVAVHGS